MEGGTRRTGSVKWFSRVKGYGFIAPDDQEKEIFVHFSGIDAEGYRNLEQGQRVTFDVEDTPKGPQAVHVTIVAAEAEAKAPSAETPAGDEAEAKLPDEETSAGAE